MNRYEVWRLPLEGGEPGFVSVALVSDLDVACDMMDSVDTAVDEWSKDLERKKRRY